MKGYHILLALTARLGSQFVAADFLEVAVEFGLYPVEYLESVKLVRG